MILYHIDSLFFHPRCTFDMFNLQRYYASYNKTFALDAHNNNKKSSNVIMPHKDSYFSSDKHNEHFPLLMLTCLVNSILLTCTMLN